MVGVVGWGCSMFYMYLFSGYFCHFFSISENILLTFLNKMFRVGAKT